MKKTKFECQNPECKNNKSFLYDGHDPRDPILINLVCTKCDFVSTINAEEYIMDSVQVTRKPKKEKELTEAEKAKVEKVKVVDKISA